MPRLGSPGYPKGNCPDGRPCATNVCTEPGCFRERLDKIEAQSKMVPLATGDGAKGDNFVLETMAQFRERN